MRLSLLLAFAPAAVFTFASLSAGAQATTDTARTRPDTTHRLEAVTISAIRARAQAPVSAKTLDATDLNRGFFGQDIPLLLQGTPSLTSHAETGNFWGYSYLRLRGIDQSRINLTIDGIPLNDPEDQVLYFADFPDLANSLGSVQIQRGVGTSAPGTASYGGSINFQTEPVAAAERRGEVQLQGGAFGSHRASAKYSTGLTNRGVALSARMSVIQSSGYRRHSGMEGRSAFLSAAWVRERDIFKFTTLLGVFSDTMAYLGATPAELLADRRDNLLRPDEADRFGENVSAISYTRAFTPSVSASVTTYRIAASGNYDVCINNCQPDTTAGDLWNFNLDFTWYGATSVVTVDRERVRFSAGANGNTYARDHFAYYRPDMINRLYFNTGHKRDASAFGKVEYDIGALTLHGDIQGRHAEFRYTPDAQAGIPEASISWTFFNPKVGATWRLSRSDQLYASYGANGREPARSDMFAGFDNADTTNAGFFGPLSTVRPEHARDLEAGLRHRATRWSLDANVFAMRFRNEILPVGQLSYIGTPLRTNVAKSRRTGLEADFNARPIDRLRLALSATVMQGRIERYVDGGGTTYTNVAPLLTPEFTSAQSASVDVTKTLTLTATSRYVGKSQLDNTGSAAAVLPSSYHLDVSGAFQRGRIGVTLFVNNVTNTDKYGGGHVAFGEARYYVLPPINAMVLLRLTT